MCSYSQIFFTDKHSHHSQTGDWSTEEQIQCHKWRLHPAWSVVWWNLRYSPLLILLLKVDIYFMYFCLIHIVYKHADISRKTRPIIHSKDTKYICSIKRYSIVFSGYTGVFLWPLLMYFILWKGLLICKYESFEYSGEHQGPWASCL